MRGFICPASAILLVVALAFVGIGLLVGAFDNVPLTLGSGVLTIGGLVLTDYGARQQQR